MKKILLAEPQNQDLGKDAFLNPNKNEPLGLEYISAYLEQYGYRSVILQQQSRTDQKFLEDILLEKPDIVGFSAMTFTVQKIQNICKDIKENNKETVTVIGGYHSSGYPQIVKDTNIDYAIIGEGEETFLELVKTLEGKGDVSKVKGIAYFDSQLTITEPRERINDLDRLPWPSRNKERIDMFTGGTQVVYSRGCPNACSYCASSKIWGRQVRWRNAEDVADEVKELEERFSVKIFLFTDLNFTLNKKRVVDICNALKKRNLKISWLAQGDINIDKELLELMKESGCRQYNFGIESTSQTLLDDINRKINTEKAKEVFAACDEIGMLTTGYFMAGNPNETEESYQELLSSLEYLLPDIPRVSFLAPFPGTSMYNMYKEKGLLLTEDFSRYTTDEPVVKSNLDALRAINLRKEVLKKYYSSEIYQKKVDEKIKRFPELKPSFKYFFKQKLF